MPCVRYGVLHWITHLVGSLGYAGVALLMVAENIVLPLPSELIMPLAGFESATGEMTLWGVVAAGTLGSVTGAFVVYAFARIVGQERVARWVDGHGRWLLVRRGDLRKVSDRFEQHGGWAVAVGRLIPAVRGLIALPAGFAHMNVALFALANFISTTLWCTALAVAGHLLGDHFQEIQRFMRPVTWGVLGALTIAGGGWVLHRRLKYMRR